VLFHGMLTGGAFYALRLARRLGPWQPVHVVPPFTGPVPPTVEAMAAQQLDLVRALQPRGPYRLVGYCNGGLVAYEIARRLREAGETVELVALIAAAPVASLARTGRIVKSAARRVGLSPERVAEPLARVRSLTEALAELPPRRRLPFLVAKCVRVASRAWPWSAASRWKPDLMDVYHRIVMRYFPGPGAGRVVVFWPEHEPWGPAAAASEAWRTLVPEVDVHVVPGDHLAVVHDHLDVLVDRLAPYLQSDAARTPPPLTRVQRLRLGLPPILVDLVEAMVQVCETSPCLA
jgi:thioesterase domain-containing protein